MPTNVYKVLGQHNSTANLIADVYTVPDQILLCYHQLQFVIKLLKTHHIQLQLHQMERLANDKHFIVRGVVP